MLSPLEWNLAFDELLNMFNVGQVHIKEFADDAALLICGRDPHTLAQIAQRAIDRVHRWGTSNL